MTEQVPIILDVDTGTDDALALAYAVASPRIDLVAVSTVAGNVDIEKTTANTLSVLDWLGAEAARRAAGGAARGVVERGVGAAEKSVGLVMEFMGIR